MHCTVIDADGHVYEPTDLFETYADVPLKGRKPYLTKDDWGCDRWVIEGRLYPTPEGPGVGPKLRYGVFRPGMLDPKARIEDMDLEGIDVSVSFPSSAMSFGWGIEDADLAVAACRAYNNFLLEYCRHTPDRLKGVAALPLQDTVAAAEELRRCVPRGLVGAFIPPHYRGVGLHHERYTPIFQAAVELDVPVMVHATTGTQLSPAAGAERYDSFFFTHLLSHPCEQILAMVSLIGGGVLERFPTLRVGFLEANAAYVPYWLERLDEHFESYAPESHGMKTTATEYFRRQCFVSTEGEERELPHVVEVLSASKILFASDYHHFDSIFPGAVARLADRDDISDSEKKGIFEESSEALYKLHPIPAEAAA